MITTTFSQLREFGACRDQYEILTEALGDDYGDETPITLRQVFDHNGARNANWLVCRNWSHNLIEYQSFSYFHRMVFQWSKESK